MLFWSQNSLLFLLTAVEHWLANSDFHSLSAFQLASLIRDLSLGKIQKDNWLINMESSTLRVDWGVVGPQCRPLSTFILFPHDHTSHYLTHDQVMSATGGLTHHCAEENIPQEILTIRKMLLWGGIHIVWSLKWTHWRVGSPQERQSHGQIYCFMIRTMRTGSHIRICLCGLPVPQLFQGQQRKLHCSNKSSPPSTLPPHHVFSFCLALSNCLAY